MDAQSIWNVGGSAGRSAAGSTRSQTNRSGCATLMLSGTTFASGPQALRASARKQHVERIFTPVSRCIDLLLLVADPLRFGFGPLLGRHAGLTGRDVRFRFRLVECLLPSGILGRLTGLVGIVPHPEDGNGH